MVQEFVRTRSGYELISFKAILDPGIPATPAHSILSGNNTFSHDGNSETIVSSSAVHVFFCSMIECGRVHRHESLMSAFYGQQGVHLR